MKSPPKSLVRLCESVSAKRPKTILKHLLKYGRITSQEIKDRYGYNHPPRAIRDVREQGIPIETFRVEGADGRKIAAYRFGRTNVAKYKKNQGRTHLSKKIKDALISKHGCRCFIYLERMDKEFLQVDHRIPFEIGGDLPSGAVANYENFMLLCASANRAKSWSCENCDNFKDEKDPSVCSDCYWAYPENYRHIAKKPIRRMDLLWQDKEIADYEKLNKRAKRMKKELPRLVKEVLKKHLDK